MNVDHVEAMRETAKHIGRVQCYMAEAIGNLMQRAIDHDKSKWSPEEWPYFAEATKRLRGITYGSAEYKASLDSIRPGVEHHQQTNSHHPEFYRWHCPVCQSQFTQAEYEDSPQGPNDTGVRYCPKCSGPGVVYETELMDKPGFGIRAMSLLDLIEMLADWKAAGERHADGSLEKSLEHNAKRFEISPELQTILRKTATELRWLR